MIKQKLLKLKEEALSYDPSMRLFILAAMVCAFCISSEYGITRPASNAIFISNFSTKAFPYAWLATVPLNFLLVYLYNRMLPLLGCLKTLLSIIVAVLTVNTLTSFFVKSIPELSFFHYIWKDLYILLMFKQLWSLIHSTIDTSRAKYLYGILFGIGGFGSIMGSLIPGFLAVHVGSERLFLFTIPLYITLYFFYSIALKQSKLKKGFSDQFKKIKAADSPLKRIFQKRYLTYILLLVVFMQMSVAFTDYQFNTYLEKNILDLDLKTQFCGRVISIINMLTTSFQFLGGFLLIHFMGLKKSHRLVPLLLCSNALVFLFMPTFGMITFSFIFIKSMDHSFFGIIREMLYIPVGQEEKFRVKAIIDVFAYRTAKAIASAFLLFFQYVTFVEPVLIVSILSFIIFGLWTLIITGLFRERENLTLQVN